MMTLFFILAGLTLSILVARYNEDDSLFWKLATSLIGAYAAGIVVSSTMKNDEQKKEKVVMIDSIPTQVLSGVPTLNSLVTIMSLSAPNREKSPKPVSKDKYCLDCNYLLSEVHSSARGQPQFYMYFSDS